MDLGQGDIVKEMLAVDGVHLDLEPSLLEIAETNDDYEMMKILVNNSNYIKHHDLIANLNKVENNKCLLRVYIQEKSVKFLCALISSPRLTVCEQYQYYIMQRIIDEVAKNELVNAGFLMSFVFGNVLPTYMIRGDGREKKTRVDDAERVQDLLDKFHVFF